MVCLFGTASNGGGSRWNACGRSGATKIKATTETAALEGTEVVQLLQGGRNVGAGVLSVPKEDVRSNNNNIMLATASPVPSDVSISRRSI